MRRGVIVLAVLALSGVAWAQPKNELNESAQAMIGAWEFANAAHSKVCAVTFSAHPAKVGYRLSFAPDCAALFPVVGRIVGWRYPEDDLLYLLNAEGNALVEFSEVEDGMFEAPTPGVGVLFLNKPGAGKPDDSDQPGSDENPPANAAPKDDGG